jgi:hypothetical protein
VSVASSGVGRQRFQPQHELALAVARANTIRSMLRRAVDAVIVYVYIPGTRLSSLPLEAREA